MCELLCEVYCRLHFRRRLDGSAQHPLRPDRELSAAHSCIVAAIEKSERAVLVAIVEVLAAGDMVLSSPKFAKPERRRPHRVVCLEQERAIVRALRESEQLDADAASRG